MPIIPNCLTHNAYTYSREHRFGAGWALFDEDTWPNIQRLNDTQAFSSDAEAAFHVLCVAAFETAHEGEVAREALRKIIRFGDQGLNPIASMLAPRRTTAKKKSCPDNIIPPIEGFDGLEIRPCRIIGFTNGNQIIELCDPSGSPDF